MQTSNDTKIFAPASGSIWRCCEFCGCKTNASERICCPQGRDTDRKTWDRSALQS